MRAAEEGVLLLCCALPDDTAHPLTLPQFEALGRRVRLFGSGAADPLGEVTARELRRLGYDETQGTRILALLARKERLRRYLAAAERAGIRPVTRLSEGYPARLWQTLGTRCPAVLFAKGDLALASARCITVVGSRELTAEGRAFAETAGRLIAEAGLTLCSGGAIGADLAAQEACLAHGGSAVIFPAGPLTECQAPARTLYLAEQAFDAPFSAARALTRNRYLHAMGEKTLVAQCTRCSGGTWEGATENLRRGYSPVFVHADGTEGAQALIARGAVPVTELHDLDELQPAQLQF